MRLFVLWLRLDTRRRLLSEVEEAILMKAIMYHYVRPAPAQLPYFRYLHVEDFVRQLDWFAENNGFITREQFDDAVRTGHAPDGVVLTFDDGLADHYQYVFPLLKERGLFGLFYVCTLPYENGRLLDVHRIHLLLGRLGGPAALHRLSGHLTDDMLGDAHVREFQQATYDNQENDEATTTFKRTLNYLISYRYRQGILDRLFAEEFGDSEYGVDDFYLTTDQIREMHAGGMIIGSHGASHHVFSKLPVAVQREEISRSMDYLSNIVGTRVTTFCYPYGGRHTFTRDTVALLEDAGSLFCFNVNPRDVTSDDLINAPQTLPRYDCNMFPHGLASLGPQRAQQAAPARVGGGKAVLNPSHLANNTRLP
jgi:peptidoglycan/xylan/chitin deacetylase (PgdA/CDA1 family)